MGKISGIFCPGLALKRTTKEIVTENELKRKTENERKAENEINSSRGYYSVFIDVGSTSMWGHRFLPVLLKSSFCTSQNLWTPYAPCLVTVRLSVPNLETSEDKHC